VRDREGKTQSLRLPVGSDARRQVREDNVPAESTRRCIPDPERLAGGPSASLRAEGAVDERHQGVSPMPGVQASGETLILRRVRETRIGLARPCVALESGASHQTAVERTAARRFLCHRSFHRTAALVPAMLSTSRPQTRENRRRTIPPGSGRPPRVAGGTTGPVPGAEASPALRPSWYVRDLEITS
jgi:hypothetical protein